MSGDKLTILIFLVGSSVAAMLTAISTKGGRSKIAWLIAVMFGLAALVDWRAQGGSPFADAMATLYGLSPFIAVVAVLILSEQRQLPPKPVVPEPLLVPPTPPKLNPALTIEYLNALVSGSTELEAKRKIEGLKNQLARLKGEVYQISEQYDGTLEARMLGLQKWSQWRDLNRTKVTFKKEHSATLETLKAGDWIEFQGEIAHYTDDRWSVENADFIGRADAPLKPRAPKKPKNPRPTDDS